MTHRLVSNRELKTIFHIPSDVLLSILHTCFTSRYGLKMLKRVCKMFHSILSRYEARRYPMFFDASPRGFLNFGRYADDYRTVVYTELPTEFILLPSQPRILTFVNCTGKLCIPHLKGRRVRMNGKFYNSATRSSTSTKMVKKVGLFGAKATVNLSQFERLELVVC